MILRKPGSDSVRPILISCVPWKVCSAAAYVELQGELLRALKGLQDRVAVPNGTSLMLAQLESAQCTATARGVAYARLVFANAFGSVSRAMVRQEILDFVPEARHTWGPWMSRLFATPLVVPNPHGDHMMIYEGLPQGNPLSAFLFSVFVSLRLHKILASCPPSIQAAAYVDDIVVYGDPPVVDSHISEILDALHASSLPPCSEKTQVWFTVPSQVGSCDTLSSFQVVTDGLLICGHALSACVEDDLLPLGASNYVHDWRAGRVAGERRECQRLLQLASRQLAPHSLQTSFLLFRALYPSRLMHLFRALPSAVGRSLSEGMQDVMLQFALSVLGVSRLTEVQKQTQCTLAHPNGWFGDPDMLVESCIARISSLAALSQSGSPPPIVERWVQIEKPELIANIAPCVAIDVRQVLGDITVLPKDAKPRSLSKKLHRLVSSCTCDSLRRSVEQQHPVLAWKWAGGLDEHSQRLCGAWLHATPSLPQLSMPYDTFLWALRERLALNALQVGMHLEFNVMR